MRSVPILLEKFFLCSLLTQSVCFLSTRADHHGWRWKHTPSGHWGQRQGGLADRQPVHAHRGQDEILVPAADAEGTASDSGRGHGACCFVAVLWTGCCVLVMGLIWYISLHTPSSSFIPPPPPPPHFSFCPSQRTCCERLWEPGFCVFLFFLVSSLRLWFNIASWNFLLFLCGKSDIVCGGGRGGALTYSNKCD